MAGYVTVIRALNASIRSLDRSIAAHLGEHPDGEVATNGLRTGVVQRGNIEPVLQQLRQHREAEAR